jgi:hypothetical protein
MNPTKRTTAGLLGVAATLLLHVLLVTVAVWGTGARRIARLPDAVGAGANAGDADGSATARRITIQLLPEITTPAPQPADAPLLAAPQQPSMLQVTGPDALPLPPLHFEHEGEPTAASDADLIARTRLAGLYESQIRARIERAWDQPSERITAAFYACRVKVRQQPNGIVVEVTLEACEGSFQWLDSLVQAIYAASPLPGPPHPSVFSESFSMQFRSAARSAAAQQPGR